MVQYKDIEGWPGYRVGDDGTVMSCKGEGCRGRLTDVWHRLYGHKDKDGYWVVGLSGIEAGRKKSATRSIAHLVLEAFVGPRPRRGMAALHRDENHDNLRADNLYWGEYPRWATLQRGDNHPSWRGDATSKAGGRNRAQRIYVLGDCERCGKPATDRHHKDTNTLNNDPSNIELLCRRCHMEVDGRIEAFVASGGSRAPGGSKCKDKPIRPCFVCGRPWKYLRKGRCDACDTCFRKYGRERVSPPFKEMANPPI